MSKAKILNLKVNCDSSGSLVVVEGGETLFDLKRIFYIYGVEDGSVRGNHANRNSEMLMVAVSGSVRVTVKDGNTTQIFDLNNPAQGLYLPKMTWKEMQDFSTDCVLLVLASEHYDKNEYITDYGEFEKEAKK